MKRILIIEDELEMLRNLTTILRLEKFRPLSAENGRVGVDLAKKQKPDLILCDVMMPGLDGYGVIAALRADAETVIRNHPLILLRFGKNIHRFLQVPAPRRSPPRHQAFSFQGDFDLFWLCFLHLR
jgi:CheY-like chemotaxis protein